MKSISIILSCLIVHLSFSQKTAIKDFHRAKVYYKKGAYYKAHEYFELASAKYSKNAEWLEKNGECLLRLHRPDEALQLLQRLVRISSSTSSQLLMAKVLVRNGKYTQARKILMDLEESDWLSKHLIASCDSARKWKFSASRVENLRKLNTQYDEITPFLFKEDLIFSSSREGRVITPKSEATGNPDFDFWKSKKTEKGFKTPKRFKNRLNTSSDDIAITVSYDSTTIFLTRYESEEGSNHIQGKLYNYVSENEHWKKPLIFNYDVEGVDFIHPAPSQSGKILFFASNMPGGQGGMDIWFCVKKDGKWKKPINAGPSINSPRDELFPHYHNGVLYFTSNGHPGYGGYDIFYSKQKGYLWQTPVNLKAPVNSRANDISYVFGDDGQSYFSSDRSGGKGGYDLYATSNKHH